MQFKNPNFTIVFFLAAVLLIAGILFWSWRYSKDIPQTAPLGQQNTPRPPTLTAEQKAAVEAVLKANPPHNARTEPVLSAAENKAVNDVLKSSPATGSAGTKGGPPLSP